LIDHLLKSDTEAAMILALNGYLGLYRSADAETPAGWRGDISFPCQVFAPPTDTGTVDEFGNPILIPNPLPYFYLWVGLPAQDDTLSAMAECVIVADRDAAQAGQPFVLWATLPATQLDTYTISPVIMGSRYPFGTI
jgi:hypothetical protein